VAAITNIDKMTLATREVLEALAENLAAAQRAGSGSSGFGKRMPGRPQRTLGSAQTWLQDGAEALRKQTEHDLRTAEAFRPSSRGGPTPTTRA
jgi:hypothetical protein